MINLINNYLKNLGKTPSGSPLFRVVWSDSQTEIRHGTFNEFYGDIFLRTVTEARSVKKYPYINSRWVLEVWCPPSRMEHLRHELPNFRDGSYEPLYVFEDSSGNEIPLSLRVVELIIGIMINPRDPNTRRTSIEESNRRKEIKEQSDLEDSLEISPVCNALHMGEGVVKP